jgi:hypothetical protein
VTIDSLACSYTNDTGINPIQLVSNSTDWTVSNCTLNGFWSQGIRARGSAVHQFDRFTATGNSISDFGGAHSGGWSPVANTGISVAFGDSVTISSNDIVLSDLANNGYAFGIQFSHTTPADSHSSIHHNFISGAVTVGSPSSAAIEMENVSSAEIYQNEINTNTQIVIWFDVSLPGVRDGPDHNKIHHNLITQYGSYADRGIFLENSPFNEVSYNIINAFQATAYNKGIWAHSATGGNSNGTVVYNNTVVGPNGVAFNALQLGWSGDTASTLNCTVKNNIFYSNSPSSILFVTDNPTHSSQGNGHVLDSNLYQRPGTGPQFNWYATYYSNVIDLNTDTGNESHGRQGDPMFANVAMGDIRLTSRSPAIGAGADLGANFALGFDPQTTAFPFGLVGQNQNGTGWAIGAFVF